MLKKLLHRHKWEYVNRGVGVYEKGKHTIRFETPGCLMKCDCGKMKFFPDAYKLRPVEAARFI